MSVWFTSDEHYFHHNIIEYCNRPFDSVWEMNRTIYKRFIDVVKEGDLVYHLGDFALGDRRLLGEILSKLPGNHVLIRGNHDRGIVSMMEAGFVVVLKSALITIMGKSILLCHHPLESKPNDVYGVFHGHIHGRDYGFPKFNLDLSVDATNFMPVLDRRALKMLNLQMRKEKDVKEENED